MIYYYLNSLTLNSLIVFAPIIPLQRGVVQLQSHMIINHNHSSITDSHHHHQLAAAGNPSILASVVHPMLLVPRVS